ncbi:GTP cyclohydrolase I [Amycolatopsis sp. lyj-23]|uniref:GTP cyclohydrolase I n=1 Tax=Amycolatopsis sp. lyj-23 TaxID=2789283 RepID=UPI0039782655
MSYNGSASAVADVHFSTSARSNQDLIAAELAAGDLLKALGVSLDHPSTQETPGRMARALAEIITPAEFTATTFRIEEGGAGLVLQCEIPFRTLCEHHMLPFSGVAHVGYLPGERVIGLSKLTRLVEHYAARPQVQERLTYQIGAWLNENLGALGAGVVTKAEHSCMALRGVRVAGVHTINSAWFGELRESASQRDQLLSLAGLK